MNSLVGLLVGVAVIGGVAYLFFRRGGLNPVPYPATGNTPNKSPAGSSCKNTARTVGAIGSAGGAATGQPYAALGGLALTAAPGLVCNPVTAAIGNFFKSFGTSYTPAERAGFRDFASKHSGYCANSLLGRTNPACVVGKQELKR